MKTLKLNPIFFKDVDRSELLKHRTMSFNKSQVRLNAFFIDKFCPDSEKKYHILILQDSSESKDFYFTIHTEPTENAYPIKIFLNKNTRFGYFGNSCLCEYVKHQCGYPTDTSVKFKCPIEPTEDSTYAIITKVDLLKSRRKK